MRKYLIISIIAIMWQGCNNGNGEFDATGTFEADEVIISAEVGGRLLKLNVEEGSTLEAGQNIGEIDCSNLSLQKQQALARIDALSEKTNDAAPQIQILQEQITAQKQQIAVQTQQLTVLEREQKRIQNLVKADAVPAKQLDDINGQVDVLEQQINAAQSQVQVLQEQIKSQREMVAIQNRGILSERDPMKVQVAQYDDQLQKCTLTNPVQGTVLTTYAEPNEITAPGKPLYKIADLSELTLRAYITGNQLPKVKLNQQVRVMVDDGEGGYQEMPGTITWIADKAEFTPKSIQTKEERQNLVYAIKVRVKNDGYLKIGMYGEVLFQ